LLKEYSGPPVNQDLKLNFAKPEIDKRWQWDFRNSKPKILQQNGQLHLSGHIREDNLTGIVLTVRPVSAIFEATTTVTNINSALKGLVYYGDAGAAIGIGISGNEIEYWKVENKMRTLLSKIKISTTVPVELKIKIADDLSLMVFYREANGAWQKVPVKEKITVNFLPQWDRSPRIGLHFNGNAGQGSDFSSFALKY